MARITPINGGMTIPYHRLPSGRGNLREFAGLGPLGNNRILDSPTKCQWPCCMMGKALDFGRTIEQTDLRVMMMMMMMMVVEYCELNQSLTSIVYSL